MRPAAVIGVLVALVLCAPARAAVVRLAAPTPAGSTTDPTCNPTPCELRRAIFTVGQAGDEIIVAPGIYDASTWQATFTLTKPNMNVHGVAGQPRPRITVGGASDNVFMAANGTEFRHLEVRSDSNFSNPINVSGSSVLQEDLILTATGPNGTAASVANGSILRDTVAYAPGTQGKGIGASANGTTNADVRNVTALAPGAQGEGFSARTNSSGACMGSTQKVTVTMKNAILLGGANDVAERPDSTCPEVYPIELRVGWTSFRTALLGPSAATVTPIGPNQTALPLFAADAPPAFHEATGSPTIDAGTPDPLLGAVDLDGEARIQGGAPDIGADETANPAASPGGGEAGASPSGQAGAATQATPPGLCVLGTVAPNLAKRSIAVLVSCTTAATGTLRGSLTIKRKAHRRARRAKAKAKTLRLAPVSVSLGAAQQSTLTLRLGRAATKALKKSRRGTLTLALDVTDAAGATITASSRVTVRVPRRARSRH